MVCPLLLPAGGNFAGSETFPCPLSVRRPAAGDLLAVQPMGEGRIDEARVIRFGGFDRGRRTVVGVREGDFVEETAAVTVVFQQFVIELSPVD